MIETTSEEKKVIAVLERVARIWPESLWLFSASGSLNVMKKRDGVRVMKSGVSTSRCSGGGVDHEFMVSTIKIESDGGDW